MKLSIVATLYQSAPYVEEFCRRASAVARQVAGDDFEIVLVNDGSPDDSLELAIGICTADPHVTVVDLSRNFGHHKAMMTGLAHARGEHVFLIDSDLEEDPEWLPGFVEQITRERCDVVFGVQAQRKGGLFERWTGQWFYSVFRLLTGMDLPQNMVTARLMTRRYVDALLRHDERELDIGGLWYITGFEQHPQTVNKLSSSETTYTLRRKLALFVNSVTSFSNAPLVYIFYAGLAISLLAGCYAAFVIIQWLVLAEPVSGWTSVIVSIWLLGGWVILFIGIIGIYLSKVFLEVKRRPYTIVRQVHGHGRVEREI
jgi:putative glycosyltransferase